MLRLKTLGSETILRVMASVNQNIVWVVIWARIALTYKKLLPFEFCSFQVFLQMLRVFPGRGGGQSCRNKRFVGSKGWWVVIIEVVISF